jgi:hypothetical protein
VNGYPSAFFAMSSECAARCAQIENRDQINGRRTNAIEETTVWTLGYRIVWRDFHGVRHVEQYRRPNV